MTKKRTIAFGAVLLVLALISWVGIDACIDEVIKDVKYGQFEKAKPKLELLAMLGHGRSQIYLGDIYAFGLIGSRNRDEAIKWYRRAALYSEGLRDPAAYMAYYVAKDFAQGLGVNEDKAEAEWWFQFAKEGGYTAESAQSGSGLAKRH